MTPATFRTAANTTTSSDTEQSPLLSGQREDNQQESMPTKRSLLASNLFGGPRALATQVSESQI